MFKHLKIKKLISAYLDKEVTEQQKALVESHLKKCPACSKYFQDLQKLGPVLSQYKSEEVSPDLEQKIKNNFLGNKYKEVAKMSRRKLLVGASSGALAILLMFVLVGGLQKEFRRSVQGRMSSTADEISSVQYEPVASRGHNYREAEYGSKISDSGGSDKPWITTHEESSADYSSSWAGSGGYAASGSNRRIKALEGEKVTGALQKSISPEGQGPIVIIEPYLPATGKEDKLIRNAVLGLEVKNVQESYDAVIKIAKDKKGYLAKAEFNEQATGKTGAQVILRVPKDNFEEAINEIRKLGEVKNFNINSMDISQNYNALVSELNTIKTVYDKIAEKLKEKKTDIDRAINLESQLTPIAKRIEAIRNQIVQYDNLISMPTITVNLHATSWELLWAENIKQARQRLAELFSGLVRGLIELLPAILIGLVVIALFLPVILALYKAIKKAFQKKSS
jgi:hypothetical protein